jgi:4-carboxymuconolactone decarboxylase
MAVKGELSACAALPERHFQPRVHRSNAGPTIRFDKIWFELLLCTRLHAFTKKRATEEIMHSASVWISSLAIAAAGGWFAATMFAAPATSKEPRFPQLTMDQLNEAQKPLGEQIMKVSSVGLGGPYNPMIRSPVLGQRLYDLFYYLRWQTSVPTKLNEFAILIIGRQWRSQVEWYAHAPLAAKAGLSPEIIAELKSGKRPSGMAEDEAVVYDFVTELTSTQKVSDETYARTRKLFNDQQIVDLTAVAGNYVMVAMLLAMAEETVPPGKEPPFKVGEK